LFDELCEADVLEIEFEVFECIDEYINENVLQLSNPLFHINMCSIISEEMYETIQSVYNIEDYDEPYKEVFEFVQERIKIYINTIMNPPRSFTMGENSSKVNDITDIRNRIDLLRNTYQPVQRTTEWYEYRHNLITASSISKILGSDAKINSLIFEKCQPITINDGKQQININSPMHWGNKYEPVSLMLYEKIYKTMVEDFGCINHKTIKCLGASPDGINTDISSKLYGRMVEIKNIVNREITGIPLEAYWVQMQTQMEVCNLDECDFFETKFNEFNSEIDFYNSNSEHTGVILYFISNDAVGSNPHYVYMPLHINKDCETISSWIENTISGLTETHKLYTTLYWYLDKMSCVLVSRNKKWFSELSPKIESTWAIIEKERKSGYEHRKPKSRNRVCNVNIENISNVCTTDEDTKVININYKLRSQPQNAIVPLCGLEKTLKKLLN
jgi:putative phage-type endonuclease